PDVLCKFRTLHGRGQDEICPVCFWHDDGQDEQDADSVWGGPNGVLSLKQAQTNFKMIGASDERRKTYVRPANRTKLDHKHVEAAPRSCVGSAGAHRARVKASQTPPPIMKPPEIRDNSRVRRAEKNFRARPASSRRPSR